jgi:hypothetical protein
VASNSREMYRAGPPMIDLKHGHQKENQEK